MLQDSKVSQPQPPSPQLQTWDTRPQHTRPPHPTRPPPLPPPSQALLALPSVRFRPDRPRQPELLRHLEERNPQPPASQNPRPKPVTTFKPYQLKPKRGQETFIEPPVEQKEVPPPPNAKQIKRITKKQDKLNKKIRHSKRKHNDLISKQNSIRKKVKKLKGPCEQHEVFTREEFFSPVELEQAFNRAYRSYRISG